MKTIYLAGAIGGLTFEEANSWRKEAYDALSSDHVLNPMRRDFTKNPSASMNEIITLDKYDIDRADILLVNGNIPSWGTAMEVLHAWNKGKIIVTFASDPASPVWLAYHSTKIFNSLSEAIIYIRRLN